MKGETLHRFPHESTDGTIDYGNGIIGPSVEDQAFFNSLPDTQIDILATTPPDDSSVSLSRFLPKLLRRQVTLRFLTITGLASAGCSAEGIPQQTISDATKSPPSITKVDDRPFDFPFPLQPDMQIQQGFFGSNGQKHEGIDFILGVIDNSATWKPFPITAPADGEACANPPDREGNATLVKHATLFSYEGHLADIESGIPECSTGKTKPVKKGDKLGTAGSTGVKDEKGVLQPGWTHLHWRVFDAKNISIDPFDKYGKRGEYPNPLFTNRQVCGEKTLIRGCPTTPRETTISARPTSEPTATLIPATPNRIPPVELQQSPKPEIKNISTKHIRSTILPLEFDMPSDWTMESFDISRSPFAGGEQPFGKKGQMFRGKKVEDFSTEVVIGAEPIEKWVKLDDFREGVTRRLKTLYNTQIPTPIRTRIAGQEALKTGFQLSVKNKIAWYETVTFIRGDQGYTISIQIPDSFVAEEGPKYEKLSNSIAFIQ